MTFSSSHSVLQECATDSEELIYQTPTSACSTQPDILINNQTKSSQHQQSTSLTMMPTEVTNQPSTMQIQQQQVQQVQQQQQQQQKTAKVVKVKEHQMKEKMSQEQLERLQKRHSIATTRHLEKIEENRMKLDEITCDFSVADPSKKPQPIQFSFTLYDVDGHGKITKDDIAGIVSTIYDSLGKSVVVPHYGKKTINVKLTVSPDAKQQQQQQQQKKSSLNEQQNRANKKHQLTPRRRYRPRALLSDDDDEDGSESNSDNLAPLPNIQTEIIHNSTKSNENNLNNNNKNNVYESINNMKCCNQTCTLDNLMTAKNNKNIEIYKNCQPSHSPERLLHIDENFMTTQQKIQPKKKLLKKSRSRRPRVSVTRHF
jgi:Ca2+-binding EF-hand superfamily protein